MFIQNNSVVLRQKLNARNIAPLMGRIYDLRKSLGTQKFKINFGDVVSVDFVDSGLDSHLDSSKSGESVGKSHLDSSESTADSSLDSRLDSNESHESFLANLRDLLVALKPWRKGPFRFFDTTIQSEWNSAIKFNLIANHLNIKDKIVADIGCNNGYYMFRMLPFAPRKVVGFEPSAFCKAQFELSNAFIQSQIAFELLGIEDLAHYDTKFDTIICLGVLYHRTNPIDCLKILKNALNADGEIIADTLIIDSPKEIALTPLIYAKMKNVYFIPSVSAFTNWLRRAGFRDIELLCTKKTTQDEQRKTDWICGESLGDFLDKSDENKTIEGYPAPIRAYFKARI